MSQETKQITLPVGRFLDYLLGPFDRITIDSVADALVLSVVDKEEDLCHVQFNDLDNPEVPLKRPIIWRKKDWDSFHPRYVKKKEDAAKERLQNVIMSENVQRVVRGLCIKYKMEESDTLRRLALDMIKKNPEIVVNNLDITIISPENKEMKKG